ncbi:MAG: hypothetical protein WD426_08340 [Anditalea sp.]
MQLQLRPNQPEKPTARYQENGPLSEDILARPPSGCRCRFDSSDASGFDAASEVALDSATAEVIGCKVVVAPAENVPKAPNKGTMTSK